MSQDNLLHFICVNKKFHKKYYELVRELDYKLTVSRSLANNFIFLNIKGMEFMLDPKEAGELIMILVDFARNEGFYFDKFQSPGDKFHEELDNLLYQKTLQDQNLTSSDKFCEIKEKFLIKWGP